MNTETFNIVCRQCIYMFYHIASLIKVALLFPINQFHKQFFKKLAYIYYDKFFQ